MQQTLKNKNQLLPLTILSEGDLIGLNQTDFFRKEELHANTLTTLTDVLVIGWPLAVFFDFIKKHSYVFSDRQQTIELMQRINFIKTIASFNKLNLGKVANVARTTTELTVKAGTVLFHKGDIGDECYLIKSGRVEKLL